MNIAIFCRKNYGPPWNEGYKNITRDLIRRLEMKGDKTILLLEEDIERQRKLPKALYKISLIRMIETIFILQKIVNKNQIDLFFKITVAPRYFAVKSYLYEKILSIPFFLYVTSATPKKFGRNFLTRSDRLFVGGDYLKKIFPKAHLVYPLVDLSNFSFNHNNNSTLTGKKIILFQGTFHMQRGVQNLLKAVAQMHNKENVKLVLAWNGGGDYENQIQSLIKELSIENITEIRGSCDISELYNEADVIVIPRIYRNSLWEQAMFFPLRFIESFAFQKPLIVSDLYEWGSIIDGCGVAVKDNHVEELRDAITKLVRDKDFYDSCRKACPSKLEKYHPDKSFSKIYKVFQAAVKN